MLKTIKILLLCSLLSAAVVQAQTRYEVTHVPVPINTTGSETGAVLIDDSLLFYTTMENQETSQLYLIDFNPIITKIFYAPVAADGTLGPSTLSQWGLNANGMNSANVAFDAKNDIIYFTRSDAGNNSLSQIYYTKRVNKRWRKPVLLGGDVNLAQYNSTHPSVGYLPDGKTILYFSSDRPGGLGGMDIWYTIIIDDGKPGNCTNLGAPVNSDSNDITPFYSNDEGCLYFSSNRAGGLGGFDIYCTEGWRNSWQLPRTLGNEVNTRFDDLFFTVQPCRCRCVQERADTTEIVTACGFLSSNRPGSLYISDSNCCHDLFRWRRLVRPEGVKPAVPQLPASHSPLDLLPLSLYFHNDEPTPCTLDTTTRLDYAATYHRYYQMRDEYKGAQPSPVDRRKWDSIQGAVDIFFDYELRKGYNDLMQFLEFLYQDLKAGRKVTVTVDGYASPLFESLYNVNLSKRRIDSFRNQLLRWNDQALLPFINNGSLKLATTAHGAADTNTVAPSDPLRNPKSLKSIYSLDAAHARRIDIVDYHYNN